MPPSRLFCREGTWTVLQGREANAAGQPRGFGRPPPLGYLPFVCGGPAGPRAERGPLAAGIREPVERVPKKRSVAPRLPPDAPFDFVRRAVPLATSFEFGATRVGGFGTTGGRHKLLFVDKACVSPLGPVVFALTCVLQMNRTRRASARAVPAPSQVWPRSWLASRHSTVPDHLFQFARAERNLLNPLSLRKLPNLMTSRHV